MQNFSIPSQPALRPNILVLVVALAFTIGNCTGEPERRTLSPSDLEWDPPLTSDWVPLFDGQNLDQWTFRSEAAKKVWSVKNGVIDCSPRVHPRGPDKHLWTKEEFEDFLLRVEWRIKSTKGERHEMHPINPDGSYKTNEQGEPITIKRRNADSGIYLRGTKRVQANIWNWPVGSGEVYRYRTDTSLPERTRKQVTPTTRADKPIGEWNVFVIFMIGDKLTVTLNGKTVIDEAPLPGVPSKGALALQHHGGYDHKTRTWNSASSLVQFRDIYIKRLSPHESS